MYVHNSVTKPYKHTVYVESNLLHVHFGIYVRVNWSHEDL